MVFTMAKKTYTQLMAEIATLEREAKKAREVEFAEVVAKVKAAISAYGITSSDLFGGKSPRSAKTEKAASKTKSKSPNRVVKFADGKGGEWVGRGPRPGWLREAIAAGQALSDFAVGPASIALAAGGTAQASSARPKRSKRKDAR